ncbi:geranyl transferase [Aerococcus urinaehominis]|uniref:Farnesyl diphosphate synthase n=1 Tax=Aerococcus urinaehominis TaxID=128944 RepID=A0A109RGJ0_9LACT|nr:farnesyl diphosphate synthase [Aerococcus urinaehominis]AMB98859.1 geranyl transferase [Aerococcus urinaehominis]SDM17029.1 farnesyl-diphosphate synthase [Aerococcus urinaehominis]
MTKLKDFQNEIQADLLTSLQVDHASSRVGQAMTYSLANGGKRVRPLLLLATIHSFGQDWQLGLGPAAAIEYIHTYSLIHDDLPAMDDDDYRRGQLANHKKFDEATAILAGDALLTAAFSKILAVNCLDSQAKLALCQDLSHYAGLAGMIGGQEADIEAEGIALQLEALKDIHRKKTGALMAFALVAGGRVCQQDQAVLAMLRDFAYCYGLAYQIQNDLQEVLWTDEKRGKKNAGDQEAGKNTYPGILGTDQALVALDQEIDKCQDILAKIEASVPTFSGQLLAEFITYLKI